MAGAPISDLEFFGVDSVGAPLACAIDEVEALENSRPRPRDRAATAARDDRDDEVTLRTRFTVANGGANAFGRSNSSRFTDLSQPALALAMPSTRFEI